MQGQSQVTGFYFKLLDRINEKFNDKIATMEQQIMAEYQQKLAELQHLTKQFENYNKVKLSIAELNAFYKYTQKGTKNIMAVPAVVTTTTINPYITRPNILSICTHDMTTVNGDCLQVQNNQPPKIVPATLLTNGTSDTMFKTHSRVMVKKHNNVNGGGGGGGGGGAGDIETFVIETSTTDIVIEFKNHEVRPEQCFLRYATFPYENKQSFSYINTILGSPDGQNWTTLVDNIDAQNKLNVYKVPIVLATEPAAFYKYLCFRSNATKDLVTKNNLQKMFNRANIPISAIEIFGLYTAPSNQTIIKGLDVQFQNFVKSFLTYKNNTTVIPEMDYVLNMFLESYKELNSLVTTFKINQALEATANKEIEQLFETAPAPAPAPAPATEAATTEDDAAAAAAAAAADEAKSEEITTTTTTTEPDFVTTSNKKIKILDLANNHNNNNNNNNNVVVKQRKNNKKSPLGQTVLTTA